MADDRTKRARELAEKAVETAMTVATKAAPLAKRGAETAVKAAKAAAPRSR